MNTDEPKSPFRTPRFTPPRIDDQRNSGNDFPVIRLKTLHDPVAYQSFDDRGTNVQGLAVTSSVVGEIAYVDEGLELRAEERIQIQSSSTSTAGRSLVYWLEHGGNLINIAKVYDGRGTLTQTYQQGGDASDAELASLEAGTMNISFHNSRTHSVIVKGVALFDREFDSSPFGE